MPLKSLLAPAGGSHCKMGRSLKTTGLPHEIPRGCDFGIAPMSPQENVRIGIRALGVNKLRSALTTLGIVVGVAAVVCMMSVGAGAQAEVSEKIRTLGANLVLIMPGARISGGARLEAGSEPTLTEEDAAAIRRESSDVQVAAPLLSRSISLVA